MATGLDRDELIAHFHEIMGIEIEKSKQILKSVNWDLTQACALALAGNGHPLPLEQKKPPDFSIPKLELRVHFDGTVSHLALEDSNTIGMLKEQILAVTKLPHLNGVQLEWPKGIKVPMSDKLPLRSLRLPVCTNLTLKRELGKKDQRWCLSVTHLPKEMKIGKEVDQMGPFIDSSATYTLYETGDKTIADLKKVVHNLTGIPPSRQIWSGFPEDATDMCLLGECSLDVPVHQLMVTEKSSAQEESWPSNSADSTNHHPGPVQDKSMGDSEDEEMLIDLEFLEALPLQRPPLMMPEDFSSPTEAIKNFTEVFEARYGARRPQFYQGSLAEAIRDAFNVEQHKRLVVLFLHHDQAVSANFFISNILCSEQVLSLLNSNFLLWPWDCTLEINRDRLMEMAADAVGPLRLTLERVMQKLELFPTLLVLGETRDSIELLRYINGMWQVGVEEVTMTLMGALEEEEI